MQATAQNRCVAVTSCLGECSILSVYQHCATFGIPNEVSPMCGVSLLSGRKSGLEPKVDTHTSERALQCRLLCEVLYNHLLCYECSILSDFQHPHLAVCTCVQSACSSEVAWKQG